MPDKPDFVLGVDLDGVCADFYGGLRAIAAEWLGTSVDDLPLEVSYGLREWGVTDEDEYAELHRFAVTQRDLFRTLDPIEGVSVALRRLSRRGVRIRIITHRLYTKHLHQLAVLQTVQWLDNHGIPYRDLCFMESKGDVGADLYVEDSPNNIVALRKRGAEVLIFDSPANKTIDGNRAATWEDVERFVERKLGM